MLDKEREITVICESPERNWTVLKPAFQRIMTQQHHAGECDNTPCCSPTVPKIRRSRFPIVTVSLIVLNTLIFACTSNGWTVHQSPP